MTTSATPPATRRIARSYLTDLVAATPALGNVPVAAVVEQLLERAVEVRHVLRSDRLVLTFAVDDDPTSWSTIPAAPRPTGGLVDERALDGAGG